MCDVEHALATCYPWQRHASEVSTCASSSEAHGIGPAQVSEEMEGEEQKEMSQPEAQNALAGWLVDVAVVLWNQEGDIVAVSPGFEQLTGYSYDEAFGSSGRFLRPDVEEDPTARERVRLCKYQGMSCRVRRPILRRSGEIVDCAAYYRRIPCGLMVSACLPNSFPEAAQILTRGMSLLCASDLSSWQSMMEEGGAALTSQRDATAVVESRCERKAMCVYGGLAAAALSLGMAIGRSF